MWGSPIGDEAAYRETLLGRAVPTFRTFTNAVMATKAYFDHHRFVDGYRSAFTRPVLRPSPAAAAGPGILVRHRAGLAGVHALRAGLQGAARRLRHRRAHRAGRVRGRRRRSKAAAKIGYPVVMKIVSADIAHKSDLGLVEVGVRGRRRGAPRSTAS